MNSQIIVIVQVLIAAIFVLWILSRRGGSPKPTVLNMTAETKPEAKPSPQKSKAEPSRNMTLLTEETEVKAKVLNVMFMWNGYAWDAYEVFGLPAGSAVQDVRKRFQELASQSDDGQRQFLSAALNAIENKATG